MATIKTNFRVVVEPTPVVTFWGLMTPRDVEKDTQEQCERMIDDIKRHVDGVGYASIEHDLVCEFCGLNWTVCDGSDPEFPKGLPMCCDDAQEEFTRKLEQEKP